MGPTPAIAAVRLAVRAALADLAGGDLGAGELAADDLGAGDPGAGDLVLVACSGGADSLALAAATAFEAPRLQLRAGAATVDHGLQSGSAQRAALTAATLQALGLDPVHVVGAAVGSAGGPEAAARRARYAALAEVAASTGARCVLLAHSRDDQAETVLLGLARGSGARSLAGMAPSAPGYRRPLLEVARSTLRQACVDAGLVPWDDPHNEELRFRRVRVRRRVLPVLEAELGPGIAAALSRTAGMLRDDADALDEWAARAGATCVAAGGEVDAPRLENEPAAVRRRVLRAVALQAGSAASDLTAVHVGALDRLVTDWHGQGPLMLPGHVEAVRVGSIVQVRGRAAGNAP